MRSIERHDLRYSLSSHLMDRWQERFSGINKQIEFASARRVGKKSLKLIRQLSPVSSKKYLDGKYKGRYCLLGRSNIVFVLSDNDVVITAFHLYGDDR